MNDGGHMHGMAAAAAPPPMHRHHMMMHMTFFWGKDAEILFDGWPGYHHIGMYILALAVVFFLALLVEWLSNCKILRATATSDRSAAAGLVQTLLYAVRISLGYLVMLAVMSFNVGVFIVAIVGHGVGFFLFGSRAFGKQAAKNSDLPPMNCC